MDDLTIHRSEAIEQIGQKKKSYGTNVAKVTPSTKSLHLKRSGNLTF